MLKYLPVSLFLMLVGWGGLVTLLIYTPPTVWPRWLFFFLGVLAVTGTALPFVAFLNFRFSGGRTPAEGVVMRQALWFGIYFPTLAWLQIPRILTPALAVAMALAFVLIEWLLRLREQSQWRP
jgi:hypothetical protein